MNNVVDVEEIELEPRDPESSSVTDRAEISADAAVNLHHIFFWL